MLYDSMQTAHGNLVLKCYKLTDADITWKKNGKNVYMDQKLIFQEIPVTFTNPGLVKELLMDIHGGAVLLSTITTTKMTQPPCLPFHNQKRCWPAVTYHNVWPVFSWTIRFKRTVIRSNAVPVAALVSSFKWIDYTRSNMLIYIHCLFIYNEKDCYS